MIAYHHQPNAGTFTKPIVTYSQQLSSVNVVVDKSKDGPQSKVLSPKGTTGGSH